MGWSLIICVKDHKKNIINGYSVESVYDYHSGYYYFNVIINNNIYCSLSDNLTFTREKECMAACEKFCEDNV